MPEPKLPQALDTGELFHGTRLSLYRDTAKKAYNSNGASSLRQINRAVKLHLETHSGVNLFTGYGAGYVTVNHVRYETHLIVQPHSSIQDWNVPGFAGLTAQHFEHLASLQPEIVLLGTGATLRFPSPALSRCLTASHIGLEAMDTNAACRTYNILSAEGRRVLAALLVC